MKIENCHIEKCIQSPLCTPPKLTLNSEGISHICTLLKYGLNHIKNKLLPTPAAWTRVTHM